ncbi:ATP-dependent DNA helicase PIF1-like [Anneissia japonica]|uniref:ATP-dependent DNA helicase PIF1-like n=1 Tax=Anneissia japonica TaxID=1529436 RepID=UPI00142588F5|nr:ATP-dependent DNA helicase PIF1-like [Anneissia japonica]
MAGDFRTVQHCDSLSTQFETKLCSMTVINKFPDLPKTYTIAHKAISNDKNEATNYPIEFLHSITPTGMPTHRLSLKQGATIMLLRNLDINEGLWNGTRLYIRHRHEHVLDAEILTGSHVTQRVLIPQVKLAPSDYNLTFTLQRIQFPVRLACSMTINKSQGQTFDNLGIYLPAPVFSHGQLYVACARGYSNVSIKVDNTSSEGLFSNKTLTQNVVYKEML